MTDRLIQYNKNVFTNAGQSDVDGFAVKLEKMASNIKEAGNITVYYGFHGDENGNFDRPFDSSELAKSLLISKNFPGAKMVEISAPDDPLIDYETHNKNGQALFTWCDSETYIRDNHKLPNIVT